MVKMNVPSIYCPLYDDVPFTVIFTSPIKLNSLNNVVIVKFLLSLSNTIYEGRAEPVLKVAVYVNVISLQ